MTRQVDAVYEHGVLRPLEPLVLAERQLVRLILEDDAVAQKGGVVSSSVNERRDEFEWLAKESGPYAGQWVALDGNRLVAHGDELGSVSATARADGIARPLLTYIAPEGERPFGGW